MIDIGQSFKLGNIGIASKRGYTSINEFISVILPNIYILAGIILFVLIIAGGFTVITSAGNPDKQNKGGKAITGAIIGFMVIFISYWLIQIVEYVFGIKIFDPGV